MAIGGAAAQEEDPRIEAMQRQIEELQRQLNELKGEVREVKKLPPQDEVREVKKLPPPVILPGISSGGSVCTQGRVAMLTLGIPSLEPFATEAAGLRGAGMPVANNVGGSMVAS